MELSVDLIVKNLTQNEPVKILSIQKLGSKFSIHYVGINSNTTGSKVISQAEVDTLEVVTKEGEFLFTGNPEKFSIYVEAERINSAYQFDPLYAVNCSVVDPLPHQVEAVYKYLLPQPKIRFLLADDTGAGKTIMTGLLIKELLMRSLIERILIVTPGGLTKQWLEDEMLLKFNLQFRLVNRAVFNAEPAIFHSSNRIITSLDFIRSDDVLQVIESTSWDIIVCDEAHKLSAFDYGEKSYRSKRYSAIQKLSERTDHFLLLTATPHRGRRDTFKNLLQLLDPDIFTSDSLVTERINEVSQSGVNKFFIRRLKEEMHDWNGNPLFKERFTRTALYELTPEEKRLYDMVTRYLTAKRDEATEESNIHVSLALMVMQRRLTSSIYAIKKTLKNRYDALQGLLTELRRNPELWTQKNKGQVDIDDLEDFDELTDEEKASFETILSDPKKYRLFTTAKNPAEIQEEAAQVKELLTIAEILYNQNQEEQKFVELKQLLHSQGVLEQSEKLVIFTEHKDTLDYLEERLKNNGYTVSVIHGGMDVDERRKAQATFAADKGGSQILIATDAAGEGINLQFCRLLINWDIPWNPNRLEQRMGRIHRYGQRREVYVFNLVAANTREGAVLQKLLAKLDTIREQIGDDRVYDVISDIFEGVRLKEILDSTLNGIETEFDRAIENELNRENIQKKIEEQKSKLASSPVNFPEAKKLKENSDEKRLQPIYIRMFFEKAFHSLGGDFEKMKNDVFQLTRMPVEVSEALKKEYNITANVQQLFFCFDKQIFLDKQNLPLPGRLHYINPGNPVFDSLIRVVIKKFKEEALKGVVLISPEEQSGYVAYFVRSRILDDRPAQSGGNISNEKLLLLKTYNDNSFQSTLPAQFIDLQPPAAFAITPEHPSAASAAAVIQWTYEHITEPQLTEAMNIVTADIEARKDFLAEAFSTVLADLTGQINELQGRILLGNENIQEKINKKQQRIIEIQNKQKRRLAMLEQMALLSPAAPEILGCAFVVPLSLVQYQHHYGMSRDDEAEAIAMQTVLEYESAQGYAPEDVHQLNCGFDIKSISPEGIKRYIEVKGRSGEDGSVMLTENEMNRLAQLGNAAWLYIVTNCKSFPELYRLQNPATNFLFERKSKGIQYFLSMAEWKSKLIT